jgi:hypothetical protein
VRGFEHRFSLCLLWVIPGASPNLFRMMNWNMLLSLFVFGVCLGSLISPTPTLAKLLGTLLVPLILFDFFWLWFDRLVFHATKLPFKVPEAALLPHFVFWRYLSAAIGVYFVSLVLLVTPISRRYFGQKARKE